MTEKNAVKSETVSPAREFSKQFLVCGQIFAATNDPQNTQPVTLDEVLDAYDAHVSQAIASAAKEAAEKIAVMIEDDVEYWRKVLPAIIVSAYEKARRK